MHKMLLLLVMVTGFTLGTGLGSAQTDAQPQVDHNKKDQMAQKEKEKKKKERKDDPCGKEAKRSPNTEGDPDAPQNKVEYGGGG